MGSLAAFLAMVPAVPAQQVAAHVGYVYPAGGRQGATLEVTIGGQFLDGVANAFVSGAGVEAKVIEHVKPLTQNQFNKLRDQLKELTDKRSAALRSSRGRGGQGQPQAAPKPAWTAEDEKLLAEIRKKMATFVRRPANPAIAEIVTLQVTMAPDAQPGQRELRLETPLGLTNPLVFCVGQLPEFSKKAAKVSDELAGGKGARYRDTPKPSTPEAPVEITLPTILNGQIMPGGVDRYRFQARKGERLVVAASARELIPYLPDAVPGWFQAALALYDAQGNELAYAGDYRFHPDPVLYYEIPSDGQYVIEIRDSIYRGREDFVYRIALGELPFVTSVFPLGGKAGEPTTVELKGWNLPVDKLTLGAEAKGPGIQPLSVRKGDLISNCEPFAVDTLPACLEQEPNDQPESAQRVTLPVIVNGRIGQPGDRDVFRFEGRAGEEIAAEVSARRLNSPLDSVLKLTDAAGRQLAFNDDCEDKGSGLLTHHADSYLRATLPADGTYYLHLGDAQQKGGAEHAYRLRISPPRPDFELRVVPSSISVRGGSSALLTVYALRKDGFSGEIALALQDAPEGFVLSGGLVPAGQDQVRLTLSVPPTSLKEPLNLHLEGRAIVEGKEVSRPAVPAEDMMQAFAYRHLVPAQELKVAVSGRGIARSAVRILSPTPVKIPAGGTARVQVGVPTSTFFGNLQLELDEPPEGITIQQVSSGRTGSEIVLQSDAAKVKPGLKGNLIVRVFTARSQSPGKAKAAASKRAPVGTLPAIPFEIVGL
jgi:hypothetical protein